MYDKFVLKKHNLNVTKINEKKIILNKNFKCDVSIKLRKLLNVLNEQWGSFWFVMDPSIIIGLNKKKIFFLLNTVEIRVQVYTPF